MTFLQKLWAFFNGKKTAIGAVLLGISAFLTNVVIGDLGNEATWILQAVAILDWVGMALAGGGLFHKGTKAVGNSG